MKKPFKHKKLIFIFCAVLLLIPVTWLTLTAIFPLPPDRKLTVTENKILIDELSCGDSSFAHGYPYVSPLPDNTFVVAIPFEYVIEPDNSKLYRIDADGRVLSSLSVDYGVRSVCTLENGNIGAFCSIGEGFDIKCFLYEYTPDFELVSKKEFTEPVSTSELRMKYLNGSFYYNDGAGVTVFDSGLNVINHYTPDDPENEELTFQVTYVGEPYLLLERKIASNVYNFYIRPLEGGEFVHIDNPSLDFLMTSFFGLTPGDSDYAFYADTMVEYSSWSRFFKYPFEGNYMIGLNVDGSYDTLLDYGVSEYAFDMHRTVPANGKRYRAEYETEHVEGGIYSLDLYLYEYTAVYED
jgi:hypothetical protein